MKEQCALPVMRPAPTPSALDLLQHCLHYIYPRPTSLTRMAAICIPRKGVWKRISDLTWRLYRTDAEWSILGDGVYVLSCPFFWSCFLWPLECGSPTVIVNVP